MRANSNHSSRYQPCFPALTDSGSCNSMNGVKQDTKQLKLWHKDLSVTWYVVPMAHPVTLGDMPLPFSDFTILHYLHSLLPISSWSLLRDWKCLIMLLFSDYWRHLHSLFVHHIPYQSHTLPEKAHNGKLIIIIVIVKIIFLVLRACIYGVLLRC